MRRESLGVSDAIKVEVGRGLREGEANVLVEVYRDGRVIARREQHNLVVNTGKADMVARLVAFPTKLYKYMRLGTNNIAPTSGQSTITTIIPNSNQQCQFAGLSGQRTAKFIRTWLTTDFSASGINEAGLFDQITPGQGNMLARVIFTAVNKTAHDTLKITWTVKINEAAIVLPPLTINHFTPGFTLIKELGDSIVHPSFTADYDHQPSAAFIDDTDVNPTTNLIAPYMAATVLFTYVKTAIGATETWTLSAHDPSGPTQHATVVATWEPRIYYGTAVPGTYNQAFITALSSSVLSLVAAGTYVFAAPGGTKKLHIVWPTSFGGTPVFKDAVTGYGVPFTRVATAVAVTNTFAVAVAGGYDVWQSDNFLVNAVTVTVS